jgi:signal transduction histidine kinase
MDKDKKIESLEQEIIKLKKVENKYNFMCDKYNNQISEYKFCFDRNTVINQMFKSEKLSTLSQIVTGLAHEINNPNNFIYFNIPILIKYLEEILPYCEKFFETNPSQKILNMDFKYFEKDLFKLIENMQNGSTRITKIISQLNQHIKSHNDDKKNVLDLGKILNRVLILVNKQISKSISTININIEKNLPSVFINAGKIEQLFINLLFNAKKASNKEKSTLNITMKKNENYIETCFIDNGIGISKNNCSKIFDPFFTTTQGTGLGLSIVKIIVEEHDGLITVDSVENIETNFILKLPIYQG